ncbi:MAG: RNA polymerase sigma factor [Anaerolineales bacterium]
MSDETRLLERARRFEEQALEEIYDSYSSDIYRYSMRLLGDQDLAEESVAETFSRFLIALKNSGGPNENLRAYLYRIAHNWVTDYYRRQPPPSESLTTDVVDRHQKEPDQIVIENIEAQEVRQALRYLTPGQQQVVVLKFLEGWRNDQIAREMDLPVGAVKSLQHRGLKSLKRILVGRNEERVDE